MDELYDNNFDRCQTLNIDSLLLLRFEEQAGGDKG